MSRTLISKWWALGLCVAFEAAISLIFFNYAAYGTHSSDAVVLLGGLTLTAGLFTIAHGILNALERRRWLLVLNGLAGGSLGLILIFKTSVTFRSIALLIALMALSLATYELATSGLLPRRLVQERLAAAVLVGFALVFLGFVFRWIKLNPTSPAQSFLWLGFYFGFSAVCMLAMVWQSNSRPLNS
jgi:uncharacterized membrane protein HdeD (DUF308 family)